MAALKKYKYLGLSTVVQVNYLDPDMKLDLWDGTVGQHDGLGRTAGSLTMERTTTVDPH